jgi:hypothetical protein
MNFLDSSFFLNIFLDARFGGVMILPNSTASSLFRPRCSTCLQEVQRGFLMRGIVLQKCASLGVAA